MQRLKSQNERFHGLIGKLGMDKDEKKALVKEVSAGRCTSSKDLTAHEMQRAIEMLNGSYDSRIERMRAKARAIAGDIGLLKPHPPAPNPGRPSPSEERGRKADYTALNSFVMRTCKVSSLFQCDYDQLRHVITALERWRDGKMKKELLSV